MSSKPGGIFSLFDNAVCPVPDQAGDHASVRNGLDINGGQKGTAGVVDDVTLEQVSGSDTSPETAAKSIGTPRGTPNFS